MELKKGHNNRKRNLSLYWKCQLIGWGFVSLLWLYIALYRDDFTLVNALVNYLLDVFVCISLTHIYRFFALKFNWNTLGIKKLLVRVIPSVFLLGIGFMQLMNLKMSAYVYFVKQQDIFLDNAFTWNPVLITGLRHMSIWVLAYHLYHFYMRELITTKENAQLSIVAKQVQLDNLSSQLNPHFLFNSLNSIKSLIIENPNIARRAVDLLSDILRTSLYEKGKDLISIEEELLLVNDYIELEKLRFEERLQLKLTVDDSLIKVKIPTLSIQLLVENAIKHGIDKKIDGGVVEINITKGKEEVFIKVLNSGTLLEQTNPKGLGLKNLKERLQIQYKNKAFFNLEQLNSDFVLASITLPLTDNENI